VKAWFVYDGDIDEGGEYLRAENRNEARTAGSLLLGSRYFDTKARRAPFLDGNFRLTTESIHRHGGAVICAECDGTIWPDDPVLYEPRVIHMRCDPAVPMSFPLGHDGKPTRLQQFSAGFPLEVKLAGKWVCWWVGKVEITATWPDYVPDYRMFSKWLHSLDWWSAEDILEAVTERVKAMEARQVRVEVSYPEVNDEQ
jgi:hypothetical protein